MTFAIASAALRRHPFSFLCTALLAMLTASLLGVAAPIAIVAWIASSLMSLEIWHACEPLVLRRLGCRAPGRLEQDRFHQTLGCAGIEIFVVDSPRIFLGRGARSLVVSRAVLDLLEDRALSGLLTQVRMPGRWASLAGELMIWLGNLPLLGAWATSRCLTQLGRLLGITVGGGLVLPLLLWPDGFVRWSGRVFGGAIVGLLGAALLSSGLAAAGLGLLLGWMLVPAIAALLAWETRRAEMAADQATLAAGLGWQLLEALETLACADSLPAPEGPLGLLCRTPSPLSQRADRVWRTLAQK